MHDAARGHNVVNGTMSVQEQHQNVVVLDNHNRVAQNVFMNFGNIASRNNQGATRIYSGLNQPPELFSDDAYTRDSQLHAISGYPVKNLCSQSFIRIPSDSQEAHPQLHDSSRLLSPPNNRRLPASSLPLENCNNALRSHPLHPENATQVRYIRNIDVPSAHNEQKPPEHGSHVRPAPFGTEQTFDSLIEIVLNHPMFPLIFKGVCETTTGKTPVMNSKTSQVLLERTVEKVEEHETLCRKIGLSNAQKFMNGVDLYFAVFNAAFKSLQSDVRPPIPGPLHAIIFASGQREDAKDAGPTCELPSHFNHQTSDIAVKRPKLSIAARRRLDTWFKENYKNPYPTVEQKQQLARECGIATIQVCTLRLQMFKSRTNVSSAD